MSRFRVVHFVPDPFVGGRVPIAALVETTDGVRLAFVRPIPCAEACGGHGGLNLATTMRADLRAAPSLSFDCLPVSLGQHAILDEERQIPDAVPNPVAWVERLLDGVAS